MLSRPAPETSGPVAGAASRPAAGEVGDAEDTGDAGGTGDSALVCEVSAPGRWDSRRWDSDR
ncbi:hypothetical protein GCM10018952_56460 [Streptosporangium vulgare]